MHDIMLRLAGHTDREAVLVSQALVEKALERLLLIRFVNKEELSGLLNGIAPLATFSAKMKLLYALGDLTGNLRDNLYTANEIRNVFAHSVEILTFDTPEIVEKMKALDIDYRSEMENLFYKFKDKIVTGDSPVREDALLVTDRRGFVIVYLKRTELGDANKGQFLWAMAQLWTLLTNLARLTDPDGAPSPSPDMHV